MHIPTQCFPQYIWNWVQHSVVFPTVKVRHMNPLLHALGLGRVDINCAPWLLSALLLFYLVETHSHCIIHLRFQLCFSCSVVFHLFSCVSAVQLCFSCSVVFQLFSCVSPVQLCFTCSVVFHLFSCVSAVQLCFTCSVVFQLFSCVSAVRLCKYTLCVGLSGVTRKYTTRVYVY